MRKMRQWWRAKQNPVLACCINQEAVGVSSRSSRGQRRGMKEPETRRAQPLFTPHPCSTYRFHSSSPREEVMDGLAYLPTSYCPLNLDKRPTIGAATVLHVEYVIETTVVNMSKPPRRRQEQCRGTDGAQRQWPQWRTMTSERWGSCIESCREEERRQ